MIKSLQVAINDHIENLKQQLTSTPIDQLDYIILAHSDVGMIRKLKHGFFNASVAVVSIPQSEWAMDDRSINDFVEWTLNELNVKTVLLAGHSLGGTPSDTVQVCRSGQLDSGSVQNGPLVTFIERVQAAQQCCQENESHFLMQLEKLQNAPAVQTQFLRNKNLVQGLFFRAESGVFCLWNSEKSEFKPLIDEDCIA